MCWGFQALFSQGLSECFIKHTIRYGCIKAFLQGIEHTDQKEGGVCHVHSLCFTLLIFTSEIDAIGDYLLTPINIHHIMDTNFYNHIKSFYNALHLLLLGYFLSSKEK